MKKLYILFLFLCTGSLLLAQNGKHALSYAGGTSSYMGVSYIRLGEYLGLGAAIAVNSGTLAVNHADAFSMNEEGIKDGGEYSWRYNNAHEYDRGYITGRLFLNVGGYLDSKSSWVYFGIGPGWSRHYFGYDRSGSSDTEYVLDDTQSKQATELELGYTVINNNLVLAIGVSAINASKVAQLTFGIGFTFDAD